MPDDGRYILTVSLRGPTVALVEVEMSVEDLRMDPDEIARRLLAAAITSIRNQIGITHG